MTLSRFFIAVAILANSPSAFAQNQIHISSATLLKHVSTVGPKQAISDYFDKPVWKEILNGIASGKADWLKVYSALRPGSDAGSGEDLGEAIYDGIPLAPFRILPLLYAENRGHYSIQNICTFGFELDTPKGGINNYLSNIERSLEQASTPEQKSIRKACLLGIAETRKAFKNDKSY